jgi:hypothetical protein
MKDLLITIYGGGDEAVAAVQRLGEDWRLQLEAAAAEEDRLRLTDAEREAIDAAVQTLRDHDAGHCAMYATLRGLLERLK